VSDWLFLVVHSHLQQLQAIRRYCPATVGCQKRICSRGWYSRCGPVENENHRGAGQL